jgi:hypothetical protein
VHIVFKDNARHNGTDGYKLTSEDVPETGDNEESETNRDSGE